MGSRRIEDRSFDELTTRQLHDLLRLRVEVFVVEQECPYAEIDGRDVEAGTRHVWTDDDRGVVSAYVRVLDDDNHRRLGRVAVRSDASREFYGICSRSAEDDASPLRRIVWNLLPGLIVLLGVYAFLGSLVPKGVGPEAVSASLKGAVPLLEGTLLSLLLGCGLQCLQGRLLCGR